MSNSFKVNIDNIEREADNMNSISSNVRQIGDGVRMMSDTLSIEGSSAEAIKNKLRKMYNDIVKETVKIDALQDALRVVANNYKLTENSVANGVGTAIKWHADSVNSSIKAGDFAEKIRQIIQEVKRTINERISEQIGKITIIIPSEKIAMEQIKAHDEYVQSEESGLSAMQKVKWSLSTDERIKMREEDIAELSAALNGKLIWGGLKNEGTMDNPKTYPSQEEVTRELKRIFNDYIDSQRSDNLIEIVKGYSYSSEIVKGLVKNNQYRPIKINTQIRL